MFIAVYEKIVYYVVRVLAILAAVAVMAMIGVTLVDVILRKTPFPLRGAYDIVQIATAVAIAGALPYTTAVKGHVAIEFLYHKLSRTGRAVLSTFVRLVGIILFGFAAYQFIFYGIDLLKVGQVTPTLKLPMFWVPWLLAFSFAIVVLVYIYEFLRPGKEMMKL
ncbi:MAG: TRAP transporter small permease [Anaerohalosphaeraceae bacterium]